MQIAKRVHAVKPSPTFAVTAKAKSLAAKGVEVLGFSAGEPDFDTPEFIKSAAVEALKQGFTKYTPTPGIPELRAAICEKLRKDNQLQYAPEQILVSCGAKHSIFNLFQALLNDGDEVIIFSPYWVSYPDIVRLAGGVPIVVPCPEETGYAPDIDQFQRALTRRTQAIILNSPCNPTGAVWSHQTLEALADVLRDHRCLIVTDDIYEKLRYIPGRFENIANVAPELFPRTVVVNGMSKAFAMTGWRLGYAAGPLELIQAMQTIQDQSTSNPNSITQKAAVAALRGPTDDQQKMVKEFQARRDLFVSGLNSISGIRCRTPEGAFYLFPSIQSLFGKKYKGNSVTGSIQISEILLDDFRVATVAGLPFGAEGYLRLSFVTSRAMIEKGVAQIREFVASLS